MLTLYGIKNCDTVKKARSWLDQRGLDARFHDFRSDGISPTLVEHWLSVLDPSALVNRRSTTWKQLDDSTRAVAEASSGSPALVALLCDKPTLIKRPVLEVNDRVITGFNATLYDEIFSK